MLRYFRINDPYRLVALFILLLLIYLPLFIDPPPATEPELRTMLAGEMIHSGNVMYLEVADNTAPLSGWFHALMDILFDRSLLARHIIAFFLLFFQSAFLGIIFITKKVFNENTFIPSLIFSILHFFSFDTLALTDELLGSGFLLLALNNLFKEIEFRMPRDETTFNLGIYLSLASLFYFPYIIFGFAILVILFLFARTDLRKVLLLIFAIALPHLVVLTVTFVGGSAHKVWEYFYLSGLSFDKNMLVSVKGLLVLGSIPLLYLVISIIMLNRLARFSKYQSQLLQAIFLWLGFCFIYFIFCRDLRPQTLIVMIPPLAFLFTHFLLLIRRRKFAEMNIWILLLGTVTFSYLARYDVLESVNYKNLFISAPADAPSNTSVVVLADEPGYYLNNTPATPFINWDIAREIFESPGYYESLTEVYNGFSKELPARIIDPDDRMRPFLERIPELKKKYQRNGNGYELRSAVSR